MADGSVKDGTENFVIHEVDGKSMASSEGSIGSAEGAKGDVQDAEVSVPSKDAVEVSDVEDAEGASGVSDEINEDEGGVSDEINEDDTIPGEGTEGNDDPKKKVSAKRRIGQLTKARREAERATEIEKERNSALLARLDAIENKLTPEQGGDKDISSGDSNAEEEGKPNPDKFTYGELDAEYQDAILEWKLDQREAKRDKKIRETRQEEAEQAAASKFNTDYEDKVAAGAGAYEDFEKIVIIGAGDQAKGIAPKYDLSPDFARMAVNSPVGHHVIYEVAKDPEYSRELAKMTPEHQAQEFGRLAAQYTSKDASPKNKKVTSAMPPPKVKVNGSGVVNKAAKDMTFLEFEKNARAEGLLQ